MDTQKPKALTEEHLLFLDSLRKSGVTNMFGARPYLLDAFPELTEEEGSEILAYWMKTFGEKHEK